MIPRKHWKVRLRGDNDLDVQQSIDVGTGKPMIALYQLRETEMSLWPDEAERLARVLLRLADRCRRLPK